MRIPALLARVPRVLRASRRYIVFTSVLFATGAVFGYVAFRRHPVDSSWLFLLLDQKFGPMAEAMSSMQVAGMAGMVFWNNIKAAGLLVVGGLAFGILPMIMVFVNGLLVGLVSGDVARQGFGLFPFILVGILPHGLFEIPGYVIGGTLGIRLGFNILGYQRGRREGRGMRAVILDTVLVLVAVVVPLLVLGSLIEVTVTRHLVEWVMGNALRWH
ncbi:MAG: stage II sporulation protein M [Bacillota bacterium]|nr:stage II sporulation protein M [Bacillota bacterium]